MSEETPNNEVNRDGEQRKFKLTSKLWFYLFGLAGLLAFIGVSAWWELTFGTFDVKSFIADTLILVAIALATMVLSDLLSSETNMNKLNGVYNVASNEYQWAYENVAGIIVYFSQWFFWFLDGETRKKREGYLTLHGFNGLEARRIVAYADMSDIEPMENSKKIYVKELPSGKKVPLPRIDSQEKKDAVVSVLKGERDVKNANYTVYLFTDDIAQANMSVLERQAYLERRRKQSKRKAYIMRIVMIVLTSLLMAALAPADEEEAGDKNKWWLFLKRLGVFVTSFISGWLAGATDTVAKASKIKDKTAVLKSFGDCYGKGLWKPKTQEELDEEAIDEWEREQEELSNANSPKVHQ